MIFLIPTDYPSGYWFGTQSLLCVMGMTGSPSSSGRKRRDVTSPSRYPLRFSHRLLFYKGSMYEWGTGTLGYFIGEAPSVVECEVTWEEEPTGNSTCHPDAIKEFTYEYRFVSDTCNLFGTPPSPFVFFGCVIALTLLQKERKNNRQLVAIGN